MLLSPETREEGGGGVLLYELGPLIFLTRSLEIV
jgi:hypothetical protein